MAPANIIIANRKRFIRFLSGGKHGGESLLLIGEYALSIECHTMHVAVGTYHLYIVVINHSHEYHTFLHVGGAYAPCLFVGIEVESHYAAVIFACNGISCLVAVNEVTAILTFDDTASASYWGCFRSRIRYC